MIPAVFKSQLQAFKPLQAWAKPHDNTVKPVSNRLVQNVLSLGGSITHATGSAVNAQTDMLGSLPAPDKDALGGGKAYFGVPRTWLVVGVLSSGLVVP